MHSFEMRPNGAAYIKVNFAALDGKRMVSKSFMFDTGATRTTIPMNLLTSMGYTREWLTKNKIIIPKDKQPLMADGRRLNAYGIPAMRLMISGHEILHNGYFLTSDEATNLGFLLGADILSYFDIFFKYSEWRVYFEFRKEMLHPAENPGDAFAYSMHND